MQSKINGFARSRAMFAAIAAAMSLGGAVERRNALDGIGVYRSRGKGRGSTAKRVHISGNVKPHQNARECARRVRQMQRNASE